MRGLGGKTVVVTCGGGSLAGAACRRFAEEGARDAVVAVHSEVAEEVATALRSNGGQAETFHCDITDRTNVDAAVVATETKFGPIDVLVNDAGWDVFKPITTTKPADREKLIAINLTGAMHMHYVYAALLGMVARKIFLARQVSEIWYTCRRYSGARAMAMSLTKVYMPHEQLDAEVQKWHDDL